LWYLLALLEHDRLLGGLSVVSLASRWIHRRERAIRPHLLSHQPVILPFPLSAPVVLP
jgi:hypothetical protein